jgi:predicted PhzF superfamily epimerase YddE/YHI9
MVYPSKGSEVVSALENSDGRLCGHATLGSAHALRSHPELLASHDPTLVFNTLSGALTVDISSPDKLLMDFPADTVVELSNTFSLDKATAAIDVSKQDIVTVKVSEQNGYVVIEVAESVDIESLNVDSVALVPLPKLLTILTAGTIVPRVSSAGRHKL